MVSRNLKLVLAEFEGIDEMFYADPERQFQALKNIISNAIKFTPDGGSITIDGRKLSGFVEITVMDTGIGIDPENLDLIFVKFGLLADVSLHSSGKMKIKGGGAGLGLPIAKGIIEAHGGSIWAESDGFDEVNCTGSTFHILLPTHSKPPNDRSAKLFDPLSEIQNPDITISPKTK